MYSGLFGYQAQFVDIPRHGFPHVKRILLPAVVAHHCPVHDVAHLDDNITLISED